MGTLTKFTHSCVRLDDGDRSLVVDPGIFSEVEAALDGVHAVLLTHEHLDHIDADKLRAAVHADPRLRVWAPPNLAASLADLGEQVVSVGVGERFEAGGFTIESFGGQHALIHPTIPIVQNIGWLIDGSVYHPGDSLIVPTMPVRTLLVPIHAPWSRVADVIDFVVSVRAPRATQIHDGLLNQRGLNLTESHIRRIGAEHGVEYAHLDARSSVEI